MLEVFREVRRVLRDDGTVWLNLGDSYASDTKGSGGRSDKQNSNMGSWYSFKANHGLKPKDLCGIPWRVAFALQADGWYLRSDIIWTKPNPMPESVTDRPTRSHEYIFLLAKNQRYYYDAEAISEPFADAREGRNRRDVWTVNSEPTPEAHFATFPQRLIEPCILAGSREGDLVLDPFLGSGTTGEVCERLGRRWVGLELNCAYLPIARRRTAQLGLWRAASP
jgi:DNA modification methylase